MTKAIILAAIIPDANKSGDCTAGEETAEKTPTKQTLADPKCRAEPWSGAESAQSQ